MGKCRNCKYWTAESMHHERFGQCTAASNWRGQPAMFFADADTGDGALAILYTKPEFGCTEFREPEFGVGWDD